MHIIMEYLARNVLLAFIIAIVVVIVLKIKRKLPIKKLLAFFIVTFFANIYVFMACSILFNVTRFGIYGDISPYHGNYIPFKTIMEYVERGHFIIFVMQIAGNILVTMPLPFVIYFYSPKRKLKQVCLVSLILTVLIEPFQLLINIFLGGPSNIIDVDDLILNLGGCMLGLLCLKVVNSICKTQNKL